MASVVAFPKVRSADAIHRELEILRNIKQSAVEMVQHIADQEEKVLRELQIRERVS